MNYFKITILTIALLLLSHSLCAQNEGKYNPVDFSLQLKNMHLWRGLQVTNTALAAVDLNIKDKSKSFTFGLWGGAGCTGDYKEFDYYLSYEKNGFKVALWDIYNFSKDATYNNRQVFNYSARETGHFIDLSIAYRFQGSFPLNISWATVIFGRDRGAMNEKNLYSTYVSMDYPVLRGNVVDVDLGLAGAFALNPEKGTDAHFYAKDAGIVNISVTASKKLQLGSYTLPVSVMGMWNPANNEANLQIALDIF
ncbi:hypothetical protein D0T84_07685 [Dysgonomonas sp. 521]|uniref:hypothetical protein n=1 Tax=Dysgonomonas sp. 521 TaxID=2302932 RepID=UPI0013D753C7|nr:hypothetical protein [Dysgonomonas sp. 521]NDV94800.1 hypothetical protein [Dysgonomonas sp. 521]